MCRSVWRSFSDIFTFTELDDEGGVVRREERGSSSCKYRLVPGQEDKSDNDNGSDFFVDKVENIQVKKR